MPFINNHGLQSDTFNAFPQQQRHNRVMLKEHFDALQTQTQAQAQTQAQTQAQVYASVSDPLVTDAIEFAIFALFTFCTIRSMK